MLKNEGWELMVEGSGTAGLETMVGRVETDVGEGRMRREDGKCWWHTRMGKNG